MIILSHRGYWKEADEKNAISAFKRSFQLGFGTETDVRDCSGALVISHDLPQSDAMKFEDFLIFYDNHGKNLPLAINIKADGLQEKLREALDSHKVTNYFVFDMSVPDGLRYLNGNFATFTRQSEYEKEPSFYDRAIGIWMDEFHESWITDKILEEHLERKKAICIVSPELHGREYLPRWSDFKNMKTIYNKEIMLCTDYPEQAREFFHVHD